MAKRLLKKVLALVGFHSQDIAKLLTAISGISMCSYWLAVDRAGTPVFIVLFTLLFVCPILAIVFSILMVIPTFMCRILFYMLEGGPEPYSGYYNKQSYDKKNYDNPNYDNQSGQADYGWQQNGGRFSGYSGYGGSYGYWEHNGSQQNTYNGYDGFRGYHEYHETGTSVSDDYKKAMKFYDLKKPFTEKELKERRRELMKTAHPDAGGSNEEAERVNTYFEILKKYAS